jgi:hypothetical protein
MQWSDAIKEPSTKVLRQFAGLLIVVFSALAVWRWWNDTAGFWTAAVTTAAVLAGVVGLGVPAAVRPIYTGWMIVAFPIGWTVSRVVLAVVFFLVISPIGWIFRLMGRDELRLSRRLQASYWVERRQPGGAASYFRQF